MYHRVVRSFASSGGLKYVQGQTRGNVREYFYCIDHNGRLFLDDARMKNFTSCFKEQRFLRFFMRNMRETLSDEYKGEFPFTSDCGPEQNYVRADGTPIVFTTLEGDELAYNDTGYKIKYEPESLYMHNNGRLYHSFKKQQFLFGLVKSSIADQLALDFVFDGTAPVGINHRSSPVQFHFNIRSVVSERITGS